MKNADNVKKDCLDVVKTILVSIIISLVLVLIFALILRSGKIVDSVISPVNYAIKILSIFMGITLSFKNPKNGILKGAISGLIYILLTYLIFGALSAFKNVNFYYLDLLFLPIAGAISGVIKVNLRKKMTA